MTTQANEAPQPLTDEQKEAVRLSLAVFDYMLRPDRMASLDALVQAFDALWLAFPGLRPEGPMTHAPTGTAAPYDRELLVDVLIYHYRKDFAGCGCGWSKLGASHPEHVADVYEQSVAERHHRG